MRKILINFTLILFLLLLIGCNIQDQEDASNSTATEEIGESETEEKKDEDDTTDNNQADAESEKDDSEKEEVVDEPITEDELAKLVEEQPLKVIKKEYVVQDDEHKALYPDMLQVIIENHSGEDIKDAVIAFAAWDEHGLPLKIEASFDLSGGSYIYPVNANDINLPEGGVYGEESGFEISEDINVEEFKAIVVSYETFEGDTWENEYFDDFKELYEGEKRK